MSSDEEERSEWRELIGELVLRFAEIERRVMDILQTPYAENVEPSQRFKERASQAQKQLKSADISSPLKEELINKLEKAKRLAQDRNDFVHNPIIQSLGWILGEHNNLHEVQRGEFKKPLTIVTLRKVVARTISCSDKLYEYVAKLEWYAH